MAENSKIGWCHHTVNLWWGCYEVHKGCDNCYAKKLANRYHGPDVLWEQQGPRMAIKSAFNDIRRYQKRAAAENTRYYIFMNSMSDIFEKPMPVVNAQHEKILIPGILEMQYDTGMIRSEFFKIVDECPHLIFLLLTKRPSNITKMIPADWLENPRPNVMFGTSIVDNTSLEALYKHLIDVPGLHFLSLEPLIEGINLRPYFLYKKPDWVIVGGESGSMDIRPMNSIWVENIKADCDGANGLPGKPIPFFLKQWGNWMPLKPPVGPVGMSPYADGSRRMNHYEQNISHRYKRSNGQLFYYTDSHNEDGLLDGVEHKNFPL